MPQVAQQDYLEVTVQNIGELTQQEADAIIKKFKNGVIFDLLIVTPDGKCRIASYYEDEAEVELHGVGPDGNEFSITLGK